MASSRPQFFKSSDAKKEVSTDPSEFRTSPDAKFTTDPEDWKKFSEETLAQFKEKKFEADEKENEFYKAYDFLREKREEAARKFGHTKPKGTYGRWRQTPRQPGISWQEAVSVENKPEQAWSESREKIVEHVRKLIAENADLKDEYQSPTDDLLWQSLAPLSMPLGVYPDKPNLPKRYRKNTDGYEYVRCEGELENNAKTITHTFQIKAPKIDGIEGHGITVTVRLTEFLDKKNDYIRIEYPPNPPFENDWKIGNIYWRELNNWKKEDGVENFLKIAGRLCHLMAPLLPLEGGSASVMEWMIRGVAEKKGIELGKFNWEEKIGWDFKAFLTPNREEYANWFSQKAYVAPKLTATLDSPKPGKKG